MSFEFSDIEYQIGDNDEHFLVALYQDGDRFFAVTETGPVGSTKKQTVRLPLKYEVCHWCGGHRVSDCESCGGDRVLPHIDHQALERSGQEDLSRAIIEAEHSHAVWAWEDAQEKRRWATKPSPTI